MKKQPSAHLLKTFQATGTCHFNIFFFPLFLKKKTTFKYHELPKKKTNPNILHGKNAFVL